MSERRMSLRKMSLLGGHCVLCVGMVCVDVVNLVDRFPTEDTDMRTIDQWRNRGGNASNNCTILAELGIYCEFFGAVGSPDPQTSFIEQDFKRCSINFGNCPHRNGFPTPNSCIIVNQTNGSRTILHTNLGLPELTLEEFSKLNMSNYIWIHFEGRNVENVALMTRHVSERCIGGDRPRISLEIEKLGRNYSPILPHVDLVFVSKEYATSKGVTSKFEAVSNPEKVLGSNFNSSLILVCPWGEDGAAARDEDGTVLECPAVFPESGQVVDTLGAGDTFIATVVAAMSRGATLKTSLATGCRVAGNKVGQVGYSGLKKFFS